MTNDYYKIKKGKVVTYIYQIGGLIVYILCAILSALAAKTNITLSIMIMGFGSFWIFASLIVSYLNDILTHLEEGKA